MILNKIRGVIVDAAELDDQAKMILAANAPSYFPIFPRNMPIGALVDPASIAYATLFQSIDWQKPVAEIKGEILQLVGIVKENMWSGRLEELFATVRAYQPNRFQPDANGIAIIPLGAPQEEQAPCVTM